MKAESVVIHKGGKEEKYKIYVEDYVISYLKYETGTLELSEIFFYGYCDRNKKEYIVYGAGRDKQLSIFDKYDLLEKITCRLTQGGPVFMVREEEELYEVKGYDIFYHDNEQMQSYLIDRKQQCGRRERQIQEHASVNKSMTESSESPRKHIHNAMSLQLGVIFVILVAIVINSTNSYDKMEQLNQSAQEVFFAIENQEAESVPSTNEIQEELVVERDPSRENADKEWKEEISKAVLDENNGKSENSEALENKEQQEESEQQEEKKESEETEVQQDGMQQGEETLENGQEETDSSEDAIQETEALSRNITRYYEIERGDTLYTISQEIYGDISKVKEICELNQISDPDNIRYGQKIILP